MTAAEPTPPDRLNAAIAAEQTASARRINPLRLGTVGFFWLLFLIAGRFLSQQEWQGNFPLLSAYLVASGLTFFASRKWELVARMSGYAIALVDIPLVYLLQRSTFDGSTSPGAVAGFTIGLYALMVAVSALSLDVRQMVASAVTGSIFGIGLQTEAGISVGGRISTIPVLGLTAVAGWFLFRRLVSVTTRLLEDAEQRKELQTHLEHNDRMASLGLLSASVAHEVGNPLTYLLGNLELMLMKVSDGKLDADDLTHSLEEAQLGATRIARILRDLRDMARKDGQTLREVDLVKVLESSLDMARAEIRKRAELVVELQPVPRILASEVRMSQVFLNLLINAAQAIPETRERAHTVTVTSVTNANGEAVVSVRDTGSGIKPEHKARLFQAFFTTKGSGKGTGLGLSITAELVRTYGGRIEVESEVGKGTVFHVVLPARGGVLKPA